MASDWDRAYIRQAESDYDVFQRLQSLGASVPKCHKLHYLQMSAEKLAKAFLSKRSQGRRQPNVHESLVRFIRATEWHGTVNRALGHSSKSQYAAFIRSIVPVAQAIEEIYPKGAVERPNPEYPWEVNGQVFCPRDHDFGNLDLKGNVLRFMKFLEKCFETAEAW